jgi:hypothetical protein
VSTAARGPGPEARDGARLRLGTCPELEQDMYPAPFQPKPIAPRTYTYLRGVGRGEPEQ